MTKKIAIAFAVVFVLGLFSGHFGGSYIDGTKEIERTVDSLNIVNITKDKILRDLIQDKSKKIKNREALIKKRDENFNNDTIVPSDAELIDRIRTINKSR